MVLWNHGRPEALQHPLSQCGVIESGCCRASGLPWFHKTISSPTSDYIELRLCCDQGTSDEDVAVGLYEIYTK